MSTQVLEMQQSSSSLPEYVLDDTKTLISALSFISRNLPLPSDVFDAVSEIYAGGGRDGDGGSGDGGGGSDGCERGVGGDSSTLDCLFFRAQFTAVILVFYVSVNKLLTVLRLPVDCLFSRAHLAAKYYGDNSQFPNGGELMADLEDALVKQRSNRITGSEMAELRKNRIKSHIQSRLTQLEELPTNRGEDLQSKCLLELYGLKLAELQRKVRSEYMLSLTCVHPEKQLFDWGMMRLSRPSYGVGDAFGVDSDNHLKKKRDAELQVQVSQKRRKQRNSGVQAWHGRQRQRATRQEKLRFQALKSDDQEAYMKMVEESKNERLTMLLGKTSDLLVRLGAAVRRQKDAEHDGIEPLSGPQPNLPTPDVVVDVDDTKNANGEKKPDLLEGQRQYNSMIHSIQEKVTEQPSILQGGKLRQYQLEGLQWMLSLFNNNLNGILADEMGLGKTIQTISLIAYLMENKGVTGPHLIVAPKAVLPNWINEFSTWAPSIAAFLYDGRLDERKAMREELSEGKFSVLITHYDLIMRDKAFLKKIPWYYMVVDEGHRLKNSESVLAKTLGSGYQIRRRLLLTGTPIQNSLQELWALLNFLLPTIFNSVENFEEWFNAPFADKCDVSLTDEEELLIIRRLHQVIRPFILRRKKDEVEKYLPQKTQVILKCDLSAWQKVYYQQVTDVRRVGRDTGTGKSKCLQNLSMQLRKCCNHPYLFTGEYNIWRKEEIVRASGKFELLDRLLPKLHRAGHRVLLFSQMTHLMDILEVYLQLHEFKYLRLDGLTKTDERGTLLNQFNAPDSPYFMFLLSTHAGGHGLNLQTADTVIIFDSDWNPQMDQQAEDRAHRIGQTKEVRVFVLVSVGSVEEVILERAKQKMGIDAKVIQAGLFNTTSTVDLDGIFVQRVFGNDKSYRLGWVGRFYLFDSLAFH
ncbi:putative DNA helicase chromatin remodeling SNF2 family [Helianthus annuus]|nr:putative DNA helicase chromatin remodeling SNF2 family [Helianthus annuus]